MRFVSSSSSPPEAGAPVPPPAPAADGAPRARSFIDAAKAAGVSSLVGTFLTSGGRFDRVLHGMRVTRVDKALAEVELTVDEGHTNAYGTLHGGATCTLVDVVGTLALLAHDAGRPGVSVELNASFCAAARRGETILARGRVLRYGRLLGFTQVDLYRRGADGAPGELLATGRHTKALGE